MTQWSTLFPDAALALGSKAFRVPGAFNTTVPAGAKYVRASAKGCGGQGDAWGGGGALARSIVAVTAGDNLVLQVGNTSTASVVGDSFVKRNDGTVIVYADRGRGNSNGGKAAFSTGQVTRDGQDGVPGTGGAAASDAGDAWPVFGDCPGAFINGSGNYEPGLPGGGGFRQGQTNEFGEFIGYTADAAAGIGEIVLEYFDGNPGL